MNDRRGKCLQLVTRFSERFSTCQNQVDRRSLDPCRRDSHRVMEKHLGIVSFRIFRTLPFSRLLLSSNTDKIPRSSGST